MAKKKTTLTKKAKRHYNVDEVKGGGNFVVEKENAKGKLRGEFESRRGAVKKANKIAKKKYGNNSSSKKTNSKNGNSKKRK